jgi:hypothetical protein
MGAMIELTDPEWAVVEDLFDPTGRRGTSPPTRRPPCSISMPTPPPCPAQRRGVSRVGATASRRPHRGRVVVRALVAAPARRSCRPLRPSPAGPLGGPKRYDATRPLRDGRLLGDRPSDPQPHVLRHLPSRTPPPERPTHPRAAGRGWLAGGARLAPPGAFTVGASHRPSRVRGLRPPASRGRSLRSRSAALDCLCWQRADW